MVIPVSKIKAEVEEAKNKWLEALFASGGIRKRVTQRLENEWTSLINDVLGINRSFGEWRVYSSRNGQIGQTVQELANKAANLITEDLKLKFDEYKLPLEVNDLLIEEYSKEFNRTARAYDKQLGKLDGQAFIDNHLAELAGEQAKETILAIQVLEKALTNLGPSSFGAKAALEKEIQKLKVKDAV